MKHILFLCTGNSCRSQMAEGFARSLLDQVKFSVLSAGLEAHGLNENAIGVMAEVGVDISGRESSVVTHDMLESSDVIVTLCGHADEHCPLVSRQTVRFYWPMEDPAKGSGSEAEIVTEFKKTRHIIRCLVAELPQKIDMSAL